MAIADLSQISAIIGIEAVEKLVQHAGGLVLKIPKRQDGAAYAAIAEVIGEEPAQRLVTAWGGTEYSVPKCDSAKRLERDRQIVRAYGEGVGVGCLARRHNLTERWIWEILKVTDMCDERQGALF